MQTIEKFEELAQGLLRHRTDMLEDEILLFWRENEPKRMEKLFLQGALRKTIKLYANTLRDMQLSLEEMELLPPSLARMTAWARLMRIEEDEKEEAEAWGMTLEEYRNRSWGQ